MNKKLKRLMTDVAKGKITMKEALGDKTPKKDGQNTPKRVKRASKKLNHLNTQKEITKCKGG